jgi:hypothetical protein
MDTTNCVNVQGVYNAPHAVFAATHTDTRRGDKNAARANVRGLTASQTRSEESK